MHLALSLEYPLRAQSPAKLPCKDLHLSTAPLLHRVQKHVTSLDSIRRDTITVVLWKRVCLRTMGLRVGGGESRSKL